MQMKRRLLALLVIAFALLLVSNPGIYALSINSSLTPTPFGHAHQPCCSTLSRPVTRSQTNDGSTSSARARDRPRMASNERLLSSSSRDTNVDYDDVTVDSLLDFWPNPKKSLTVEPNRPSFAEVYNIDLGSHSEWGVLQGPPLLVDVTTDKGSYRTDETIYITANVTQLDGTPVSPPGWANVNITVWADSWYLLDIMPNTNMTYDPGTLLWEYSCTVNVTDPSAQFPYYWKITVSADDGLGNTGVGSTAVSTVVYVGPSLTHVLADGRYDEFGSIVVDGGILIINNSQVVVHPLWPGAHNITGWNRGTIMVENSTIYSELGWDQWMFWIIDDSNAYLNFAEIRDLLVGDFPGFLVGFGSSLTATDSWIKVKGIMLQAVFSGKVTMEDSIVGDMVDGAVVLMDGSKGYFDNATMGMLLQMGHSNATVKNSRMDSGTSTMSFSHIIILNSHLGALSVYYNSTATITDSFIDYNLSARSGSSVAASNLTIGYGLYDWVNTYIDQFSKGEFTNLTMTGHGVSINCHAKSSATYSVLNCTGYYIGIDSWNDVSLTIENAVINATRYRYYEESWFWDGIWQPGPPPPGYDLYWEHMIIDEARGGRFSLRFGDKALVSLTNVDIVEAQYVNIDGHNWAEMTATGFSANVTGGYSYVNYVAGDSWPVPPGWIIYEVIDYFYHGGDFNLYMTSRASLDLASLSIEADHVGIQGYSDVEASLENVHLLSRGHYSYSHYAEGNSTGIYYYYNSTWSGSGQCDIYFGEDVDINLTDLYIEAEQIDFHGDNGIAAAFEDFYLVTPTMGHFSRYYEEWIDILGVTYEIYNLTWYQPSYIDLGFYRGAHIETTNITVDAYDEYHLSFSEGGNVTLSNCSFISHMMQPLNYTWYYHYLYGSEETEYTLYEPSGNLWADGGMEATMINSTFTSYRSNTGFGSGCWTSMENVHINSTRGNFGIYDGSVIRFTNCSLDLDYFWARNGAAIAVENSNVTAYEMSLTSSVYGYLIDTEVYASVVIDSSEVTMKNCLLNSTLMSTTSYTTLIYCNITDDVLVGMGGSLTIETTTLMKTLYVTLGPTITVKDSTTTIEATMPMPLPPEIVQNIYWLNAYNAQITLNGTINALWVYNLHNHYNASMIYTPGTVNILQQRWCLGAHVTDDYGDPIPSALVEIRNSTMDLIYSGYTNENGTVRIYPENDVYTVTAYANGETDTDTVTINDMCAETSFQLDTTKPVISNITQDPTTPNYTRSVTVVAEISDPSGIASTTLKYSDGAGWTDVNMTRLSGNQYSGTIPAKSYGTTVRYYIVAVDNSNNTATSDEYMYNVIDDLMPESSEFTLDPTTPVYYQDVAVSVTLTDPNGIVEAWLIFSIDGDEYRVQLAFVGANRYSAVIPKQPYGTEVTYSVWAKDGLGNAGTTTPLTYTVSDDIDPTGEITSPSTGSFVSGTLDITVAGYDINFNRMELYVNTNLKHTWTTSDSQTYALDTTTLADGTYILKLVVYDQAGNSTEKTITITVDNTDPTVSTTSPEQDDELVGTVSINFDGSDTNLDKVYLYIDNTIFDVTGSSTYNWDTTTVGDGSHTIKIVAIDKAGNQNETQVTVKTNNVEKTVGENMIIGFAAGSIIFVIIGAAAAYFLSRRRVKPTPTPTSKA